MTDMKRFMVSLDEETAERLDKIKQQVFYNRPYSVLVREVLKAGLAVYEQKEGA